MDDKKSDLIGVIPSGGLGKRMRPFKSWKELIPIGYRKCEYNGFEKTIPKVVGEYTLENMIKAGAKKIIMIVNENKGDLMRFYSDGSGYNANISYICQDSNAILTGMPIALDMAYPWMKDHTVLMGMPDTIVEPAECFSALLEMHFDKNSDLTLGVFPTTTPTRLAPVLIENETGCVKAIFDKPKETDIFNTWNVAVWSTNFSDLLHEYVTEYKENRTSYQKELLLSDVFNLAIERKLNVFGLLFKDGSCYDLGNIDEFILLRREIEEKYSDFRVV